MNKLLILLLPLILLIGCNCDSATQVLSGDSCLSENDDTELPPATQTYNTPVQTMDE